MGLLLLAALPCQGITIAINDPNISYASPSAVVMQAQFRPSAGADAHLSPYDGAGGTGTTAVSADLGSFANVKNRLYNFTLTNNYAGSNLIFSLTPAAGGTTTNLIWGTGGTPTLVAPDNNSYGPQTRGYNALQLLLVTPQGNNSGTLNNLQFLIDGQAQPETYTSAGFYSGSFTGTNPGPLSPQWIVVNSSFNLAQQNWTLSGQIRLNATGNNEGVAFRINGRSVDAAFAEVPEPSAYLFMATVAGALYWRRRKLSAGTPTRQSPE
jgi:hypothetical protein